MKNHIRIALPLLSALCLTACSDDNPKPAPELSQKEFTGREALEILYCRVADPGHTVTVTPTDDGNAILTLYSTFDLSQLGISALTQTVPTAGVLPGSPSLQIPVRLSPGDGVWNFSGDVDTPYATSSLSGSFSDNHLQLNLPDVKLKNTSLAGTVLKPSPLKRNPEGTGYSSTPFHLVWETLTADGTPGADFSGILRALVTLPCIPVYHNTAYSSISQLLVQSLQTVALLDNGNVIIRYYDSSQGATQLMTTQGPTLQYVVPKPGIINLYPNAEALAGMMLASHPGGMNIPQLPEELRPIGMALLKDLMPLLAEGIPMQFSPTPEGADIYINTKMATVLIADLLKAIENDPAIIGKVKELLAADPNLAEYLPMLEELLNNLPTAISHTSRIEIGFSFKKD